MGLIRFFIGVCGVKKGWFKDFPGGLSITAGMGVPLRKTAWPLLKKQTIHVPHDPAVPLLGDHPRAIKAHVRTKSYTRMFIAAFFVTAPN